MEAAQRELKADIRTEEPAHTSIVLMCDMPDRRKNKLVKHCPVRRRDTIIRMQNQFR